MGKCSVRTKVRALALAAAVLLFAGSAAAQRLDRLDCFLYSRADDAYACVDFALGSDDAGGRDPARMPDVARWVQRGAAAWGGHRGIALVTGDSNDEGERTLLAVAERAYAVRARGRAPSATRLPSPRGPISRPVDGSRSPASTSASRPSSTKATRARMPSAASTRGARRRLRATASKGARSCSAAAPNGAAIARSCSTRAARRASRSACARSTARKARAASAPARSSSASPTCAAVRADEASGSECSGASPEGFEPSSSP